MAETQSTHQLAEHYIGGVWSRGGGAQATSTNSARPEDIVADYWHATQGDIHDALEHAQSARGQWEGLMGNKVGSTLGFLWNEDLENLLGNDLSLYETTQALYADLASGRISVVVDTFPSGQAALQSTPVAGAQFKVPAPDDRVVSTTMSGQTNFPVNLNNPGLQEAINNNLKTLRDSGVLAGIAEKWGFSPTAVEETVPNLL